MDDSTLLPRMKTLLTLGFRSLTVGITTEYDLREEINDMNDLIEDTITRIHSATSINHLAVILEHEITYWIQVQPNWKYLKEDFPAKIFRYFFQEVAADMMENEPSGRKVDIYHDSSSGKLYFYYK